MFVGLADVVAAAAGYGHTCAVTAQCSRRSGSPSSLAEPRGDEGDHEDESVSTPTMDSCATQLEPEEPLSDEDFAGDEGFVEHGCRWC